METEEVEMPDHMWWEGTSNYLDVVQRTGQWLEHRRGCVLTSSEMASCMPFTSDYANKYRTALQLFDVKTGRRAEGPVTPAMQYGIDNEQNAIKDYQDRYNVRVFPCGMFVGQVGGLPVGGSPDGLLMLDGDGKRGIVEVKCSKAHRPNAKIPGYHIVQCMSNMHLAGAHYAVYISWHKKGDFAVDTIYFEPKTWELMEKHIAPFAQQLVTDSRGSVKRTPLERCDSGGRLPGRVWDGKTWVDLSPPEDMEVDLVEGHEGSKGEVDASLSTPGMQP
jgi:hypothetical protein